MSDPCRRSIEAMEDNHSINQSIKDMKARKQNGSQGFMEDNRSSPLATCLTKIRSITRDIWQDASDPELRVHGRIFQLEMLEVKGE